MSLDVLSSEAQLLLLAAGGAGNDARIGELAARGIDWGKLGWIASRERAAPVLWERLQSVPGLKLPEEAAQLRKVAMVSDFRMRHLESRLDDSLEALERAGVDALLLKGAALAVLVYGSFSRRPMSDVDVLVRHGEAARALPALLAAGWTSVESEGLEEFYRGHHHLPALEDARGTGVQLELHTALFFEGHPFRLSPEDIWARAERIDVRGHAAYVPSIHDQLLHLCLHFAWSHMMSIGGWRSFRDLNALLGTGRVKWPEFTRLALESRGGSCCYWTFRLAGELAGVQVPREVLQALRPPLPELVLARLARHFTYSLLPTETLCPSVSVAYTMWRLGVRPGWSGHGTVRPWDRSDDLLVPVESRKSGARRMAEHVRNLRGWGRYVRAII
ncbi:MAG TPA: nucleotidyltransferase family protein [Gemmatimonadaceae bacterium]|nr:nucleotidyltransferase family protein [Gemmatimonadaceae bacterium]